MFLYVFFFCVFFVKYFCVCIYKYITGGGGGSGGILYIYIPIPTPVVSRILYIYTRYFPGCFFYTVHDTGTRYKYMRVRIWISIGRRSTAALNLFSPSIRAVHTRTDRLLIIRDSTAMHHHLNNQERTINLSIQHLSGPRKFPRVESNYVRT